MGKSDKLASMQLMVSEMKRELNDWQTRNDVLERAAYFAEIDGLKELARQIRGLKKR